MAVRYSGKLKINVTWDDRRSAYKASVSHRGRSLWSGSIGAPTSSRLAADNPLAYDGAARDALAFASRYSAQVSQFADYDAHGGGWVISRSPAKRANPSPKRRSPAAKRRTVKHATRRAPKRTSKRPSAKRRTVRARTRR